MQQLPGSKPPARPGLDWRGWVALAWALAWGCAYCDMALKARGSRVVSWFRPLKAETRRPMPAPDHAPWSSTTAIGPDDRN
jgi:hypothetical protein